MARFMIVAVGADRPGVVAAMSGALVELGCNLSDTQMAVLQGYASMMLVVDAPPALAIEDLHRTLVQGAEGLGQTIWVHSLPGAPAPRSEASCWQVSVYGADHPGVVFEVTRLLADLGVNITDLQSRMAGTMGSLSMQVEVPPGADGEEIAARVDRLGDSLGLSCSMRPGPDGPPGGRHT